jgi:3D-(3,5/4)-trihydroxycyclohexane-1,2-dione acylhydrolase (decyclizing)
VSTVRLTVAQALVRFLARQYSECDGVRQRLIAGCFGIFGHGKPGRYALTPDPAEDI